MEAIATKLEAHMQEGERRFKSAENRLDILELNMGSKVSITSASWAIGILITILISMFGWISVQIADMQKTTTTTKENVATIKGRLDPYNIEFKN